MTALCVFFVTNHAQQGASKRKVRVWVFCFIIICCGLDIHMHAELNNADILSVEYSTVLYNEVTRCTLRGLYSYCTVQY